MLAAHHLLDQLAIQRRREQFNKGVDITAQIGALLQGNPRHIGAKQVPDRNRTQALVALGVKRHARNDANAHPQLDVSLDHVGIDRLQQNVRLQIAQRKRLIDLGPPGKGGVISNQREDGNFLQRDRFRLQQGMIRRHHDHVLPLIARDRDQAVDAGNRFRRDRDIGMVEQYHFGDLLRIRLQQGQADFWKFRGKRLDNFRQRITRLGVGGRDGEAAAVLRRKLLADALEPVDFLHDHFDRLQHCASRFGQAANALAVAGKDIDSQLFFQLDDGLGYARLRREKRLRGFSQVEILSNRFAHKAQLVQVHVFSPSCPLRSYQVNSVFTYTKYAYKQIDTKYFGIK